MSFIEIVRVVVQLLPLIIDAIKVVESAVPESGKGAQKLDLVKSVLEGSYTASNGQNFNAIWAAISTVISGLVKVFNSTGVFVKNT